MDWTELIGYGGLAPAATAFVVLALVRVAHRHSLGKLACGLAIALAFFVAYALLPWAPLKPDSPWHWFPLLAVLGFGFGMFGMHVPGAPADTQLTRTRISTLLLLLRMAGWLVLAAIASWLLVPSWDKLAPVRG